MKSKFKARETKYSIELNETVFMTKGIHMYQSVQLIILQFMVDQEWKYPYIQ